MRRFSLVVLSCFASGCAFLREATVPMPALHFAAASQPAEGLIVLLPGYADLPERYEQQGFVDMIRAAQPGFDVIAADAHYGYYRDRTLVERLHDDLIGPVLDRYERVWFVGISMGGFGAPIYAIDHPEKIEGMILLAPFMGYAEVIGEIKDAGGLAAWTPPDLASIEDEERRKFYEVWSWFRCYTTETEHRPRLFLGYGTEDDLEVPNGILAAELPPERVMTLPGGHKWTVWQPLFAELVHRAFAPD